jgi:hypothetical protein
LGKGGGGGGGFNDKNLAREMGIHVMIYIIFLSYCFLWVVKLFKGIAKVNQQMLNLNSMTFIKSKHGIFVTFFTIDLNGFWHFYHDSNVGAK